MKYWDREIYEIWINLTKEIKQTTLNIYVTKYLGILQQKASTKNVSVTSFSVIIYFCQLSFT